MNRILGICLLIAGCHVNVAGQCSSNADCTDPARCDTSQHVCVVPQDACYPFCPSGKACIAGTCQDTTSGACTPACPSDKACVNNSCQPVTQASVFLTSPVANDFVVATVQASAVAFAPGGVSSVRFELRSTAGAVLASATATAPVSGSSFAASIPLAGISVADGPAVIVAVVVYAGGSRESAPVSVNLDRTPPVINVAADTNWYARTLPGGAPNIIVVTVPITDAGSGVASAFLQVGTGPKIAGTFVSPNWQFQLDATQAAPGVEAPLAFTIGATDNVGNQATPVGGSRNVDDVAPLIAHVKVYLASLASPPTADGVTPPGSGSFLYTDNITISGELTDLGAGLAVSGAPPNPSYVLNGIGGSAVTVAIAGCTAAQTTKCTFSVTGSLRAATFLASSGTITLTVGADDLALSGDGVTPAHHHSVSTSLGIPVTRVKWSKTISALTSVSGLAIHPDGDVIAAGVGAAANSNTVIAVHPDGTIYWQVGTSWYANNSHLGQIDNAPSIGAGGNSAPIYVATVGQDLVAINPNPTTPVTPATARLWQCGLNAVGQAMHSTPAVATITPATGSPYDAIFSGDDFHQLHGASFKTATTCNLQNISANPNCNCKTTTSVINLGATLYQGFDTGGSSNTFGAISGTPLGTGLAFSTAVRSGALPTGFVSVTSLSTDGTLFFGMDRGAAQAYSFTAAPANGWSNSTTAGVNGDAAIEAASGGIIVNTNDKKLRSLAISDGTASQLGSTFSANGSTPLLGSNGYLYFGDDAGSLLAVPDPGYGTSWSYKPSATAITAAPTLDCSGTLYFAAGNIVYAVITDSIYGLRQSSPWPKYQRDSRNSGNADATTFWGRDQGSSANPRCVQ